MALELIVVTPNGEAFSEPVEQVVLPGSEGEFGVLESHEKFLAPLRPGPMQVRLPGGRVEWAALSDGFAEVTGERVVVLVDECTRAADIDIEQARTNQAESTRKLAELADEGGPAELREQLERTAVRSAVLIDVHARLQPH
ncbi:MAG TPA: ATP synthase F1 subunit epsilon [Planctomycetota bacterium]|nr:ATP synthase F1 subunit epsilon [Planctomycetota bacterium]